MCAFVYVNTNELLFFFYKVAITGLNNCETCTNLLGPNNNLAVERTSLISASVSLSLMLQCSILAAL